jgi:hypothetical protein
MKRTLTILLMIFLINPVHLSAEEGMWLPTLIGELRMGDMHAKGFRLTAEDIYQINHASITGAVVSFGGFCTGELVSAEGLLLTNHHCGLESIQQHSSLENNYLEEGFWAMSREEELPSPELFVRFLREVRDVTGAVMEGVEYGMSEESRGRIIDQHIRDIQEEAIAGTRWKAVTKSFYYGSEYYMFLYEEFNDIRLVGAPPRYIGNFGGDTDNWVWPRHTGDFSLFRIYADKDNNPAMYDVENVPYRPGSFLPVSTDGVDTGDFTMVCGFPGHTFEYLLASELAMITRKSLPAKIRIRTERMEVMHERMDTNEEIRIRYAAKYARVTNAWKKWQGVIKGLDRVDAIQQKRKLEKQFAVWAGHHQAGRPAYEFILDSLEVLIRKESELILAYEYQKEVFGAIEVLGFAGKFPDLVEASANREIGKYMLDYTIEETRKVAGDFFEDYEVSIDREVFKRLLRIYAADLPPVYHPQYLRETLERCRGDTEKYTAQLFDRTIFTDRDRIMDLLANPDQAAIRQIEKDPVYLLALSCEALSRSITVLYHAVRARKDAFYRIYVKGLREMQPERDFYADANGSMRITYGQARGYSPGDAIRYGAFTTLDGIIEKGYQHLEDYRIPEKLMDLYREKDFGPYAVNGSVPVCFIAANHTSGGNSGSPVLNADGRLIGINFDRNWEGTMSDYVYDPEQCRNISVDIRYVLFIIDRYAGAGHLIDEMRIMR